MDILLPLLRALASLSATLGLIVLCAWAWKRYGTTLSRLTPRAAPNKRLHVLESRRLNAQTTLHLIRLDATEHLLATTASQTTVISSTPAPKSAKVKP